MNKSIFSLKRQHKSLVFISAAALSMPLASATLWAAQEAQQPGMEQKQQPPTQNQDPEKALPMAAAYKASQLLGKPVKNRKEEDLGKISELVVDKTGQVKYAVLSHGGVLGMGAEMTAVSWKLLQLSPKGDHYILNLEVSKEQLADAPTFSEDNWPSEAQLTEFSTFEPQETENPMKSEGQDQSTDQNY